ncbi:hypothetical protein [Sphingomonas jaspsi]|uniref:hypothetical protein n=1 Tax=Sphingomonas jaspsi TaxID=392409 RepID=UPI0004B735A9|nr:hypothetical protein [Sphingomonas jaspsi]
MPQHDPVPGSIRTRFLRILRLGALFSIAIAAIAVILVAKGGDQIRIHMLIATALGVGLSVLMGIALMALMFLSSQSGHDERAADHQQFKDNE